MIEDNNTEETKLEQALANDDSTTNIVSFPSNTVTYSGINTLNLFPNSAGGTYVPPQQQTFVSGTAYVNISPNDFAAIRTMIRKELHGMIGEIAQQVGQEMTRQLRIQTGASRL